MTALLLGVLPLLYFGHRLGLFRKTWSRRGLVALALVFLAPNLPWNGLDFAQIKRLNLLIASAVLLVLALRSTGARCLASRPAYLRALTALAALAVVAYLNFFSFHGERTFVHYHDVAHYYLGSKYFRELGYGSLYTAMLRAEAESEGNHFKAIEARDLRSGELVHIRVLLEESAALKAAFTPQRWAEFRTDVAYFRDALGPQHGKLFQDHGFNATPLWALGGGALANLVPAGSGAGILLLTLLDPLLILAAFAAVAWAFGAETALLAVTHFCIIFGATFGWTGGAFLRFVWFFGVVAGFCCLARGREALAGALFAIAAVLRIFPAFFMAGLLFKAAFDLLSARRFRWRAWRPVASFAGTAAVLVLTTVAAFGGLEPWRDFKRNLDRHVDTVSPNIVGLTQLLAHEPGRPSETVTGEELRQIRQDRARLYDRLLVTAFPIALLVAAMASLSLGQAAGAALGVPLLFIGTSLASYYYAFLVVLVLVNRDKPRRLMLVFGAEALSYVLLLFEEREAIRYVARSLILSYLFAALALDWIQGRRIENLPSSADGAVVTPPSIRS
jgi:hypothetical protein